MELFERAKTVRLKGPHGKYLWAGEDHYTVSQRSEDKNEQALWRVERQDGVQGGGKEGKGQVRLLRLKSCFDAYLTAEEHHDHGPSILRGAGKRVTQMRAENVDSTAGFDWEPHIVDGHLMLKSCFGTFLRGNSPKPPWYDCVTHDIPLGSRHKLWLVWEVEKVSAPNIAPLELLVGPIHQIKCEATHPTAGVWSKQVDESPTDPESPDNQPRKPVSRRTRF